MLKLLPWMSFWMKDKCFFFSFVERTRPHYCHIATTTTYKTFFVDPKTGFHFIFLHTMQIYKLNSFTKNRNFFLKLFRLFFWGFQFPVFLCLLINWPVFKTEWLTKLLQTLRFLFLNWTDNQIVFEIFEYLFFPFSFQRVWFIKQLNKWWLLN